MIVIITYRTLENTPLADLHTAFVSAYSDYEIPINMPLAGLSTLLAQNGYVPSISIGAFEEDRLIGFILNGARICDGIQEAYDTGTGVVPEWRRKAVMSKLFEMVYPLLRKHDVKRYWLQVLKSNAPAVSLYKKQGFKTERDFFCFDARKESIPRYALNGVMIVDVPISSDTGGTFGILGKPQNGKPLEYIGSSDTLNSAILSSIWDFIPSWQNTTEAVSAAASSHAAVEAFVNGTFAAYGIIDKNSGRIPQLAVIPSFRRQGVGARVLSALIDRTEAEEVSCINIDSASSNPCAFLDAMGFKVFTEQYEMVLTL